MNHCSHWTRFYGHPAYRDFDLYDEGLRYVFPEGNEGMIFEDGSSFIGYSSSRVVDAETGRTEPWPEGFERTHEQIRAFSRARRRHLRAAARDASSATGSRPSARTASRRRRRARTRWRSCSTIPDIGHRAGAPVHDPAPARLRLLRVRRAADAVHARVHDVDRLLPGRRAGAAGARPQPAAGAVVRAGGDRGRRLAGDQRRARLGRAQAGRRVLHRRRGRRRSASRASARRGSSLATARASSRRRRRQRARRAADRAAAARGARDRRRLRHRIRNIHYDRGQLLWANLALHEPPDYGDRPASARSRGCTGGRRIPTTSRPATSRRSTSTASPRGRSCCRSVDTLWDPSARARGQAHRRRRGVRGAAAAVRQDWNGIKERFGRHLLARVAALRAEHDARQRDRDARLRARRHRGQAPGHDRGRLLGRLARSPRSSGRFRPIPELSGYRMVLENLYNCSSNMHSGSGIGRGSSSTASTRSPPTSASWTSRRCAR